MRSGVRLLLGGLARFKVPGIGCLSSLKSVPGIQRDEIVPFRHGRKLFDAANEPRVFLEISESHNEGFITSSSVYINGLKAFLDRIDVYFSSHQKALAWGRKRVDVRIEK
ncbi:MAG: hypothetical protein GQ575_06100 [Deltaproteobacteria bacterium]|nr:hypothetical protein [Deltaproteobacteria bacterium]